MCPEDTDILSSWESAPLAALVSHIVETYHHPSRRLLARIAELHAAALSEEGESHPFLNAMAPHITALVTDLQDHFKWEEQSLFPAILAKDMGRTEMHALAEEEHAAADELLINLRAITRDFATPQDGSKAFGELMHALADLETSLHRHLFLETHVLFARGMASPQ